VRACICRISRIDNELNNVYPPVQLIVFFNSSVKKGGFTRACKESKQQAFAPSFDLVSSQPVADYILVAAIDELACPHFTSTVVDVVHSRVDVRLSHVNSEIGHQRGCY
jgi:hypothetical protein